MKPKVVIQDVYKISKFRVRCIGLYGNSGTIVHINDGGTTWDNIKNLKEAAKPVSVLYGICSCKKSSLQVDREIIVLFASLKASD